ncbi:Hypothetical predicted protein, partial [Mytilus galloprovincialis]
HHGQHIREWEQDQTTFLETRATRHILESLSLHNCIVVTGSSGCGKSSNIHHAALHLRDSFGYEIIPVLAGPNDIMIYYNANERQVFIVDDIGGKETVNKQTLQTWGDKSEELEKIFKVAEPYVTHKSNVTVSKVSCSKLLLSCRLHIYKESQFQRIEFFTKKECNLLSSKLCLMQEERMLMLHKYLPGDIINNIKQVTENVDYFPLLCKLSKNKTSEEVKKLFTAPLISIKNNILNIIEDNIDQFCALVLCILFDDGFNTDWLTLAYFWLKDKLDNICKEFDIDLSKEKHRNSLKSGFSTLTGTYLKLRGTEYRIIHDKIYKLAVVICGQQRTECFIKYASPVLIRDNFIIESLKKERHEDMDNDDLVVLSEYQQEQNYFARLLCDLKKHVTTSTFKNYQLKYQTFRNKLICYFRKSDDAKMVLKKLNISCCPIYTGSKQDKYLFNTPLIESVISGYSDLVRFQVVDVKCDVNKTDTFGRSPIYEASERGNLGIVKLLLENYANISQCNAIKQSPLFVACKEGHTCIVELLIQHKADILQTDVNGWSPLFKACEGGYKDTVKLLLLNKADVCLCSRLNESPLYAACKGGHIDIVELLLQNKADVNQRDKDGMSPLLIASWRGDTYMVDLLLKSKAVYRSNNYGFSPLYVACKEGYLQIVKLLLKSNSQLSQCNLVNQCNGASESPLYVACKKGHTDVVKLLLQNKADVNQCNKDGESPFYVACNKEHTDIIEMLRHHKVDVLYSRRK